MIRQISETLKYLREHDIQAPETGIILGTGLGQLVSHIDIMQQLDYVDIPHFPIATVEFHSGKLVFGELCGRQVLVMQGRFHYYEGYDLKQITFPVRVMKYLGVKQLLISNVGGAMNLDFKKGSLILIEDHINLIPDNPLRGKYYDEFGPRFPDMSQPYSRMLNEKMIEVSKQKNIKLHKGIYVAVPGPSFETRAEYRYLRSIGADVVGMSTVPEVIVANQMGLPCSAVSVITDECDPDDLKPLDINDILAVAARAEEDLVVLFKGVVSEL